MEHSIVDLWRTIRKRWILLAIFPVLALATGVIINLFVLKPVYQATATVIVGTRTETANLEYSSVMANQQLAKTYEAIAKSRTVLNRVADQLSDFVTVDELLKNVTIEAVKGTEVIAVKVNHTKPEIAVLIANRLTEEFAKRVAEVKKVESVGIIDYAFAPTKPVKPKVYLNVGLSFILGLAFAVALAMFLEVVDNSIKTQEELEMITELNVIGLIPRLK